jgi:hypothetical protein
MMKEHERFVTFAVSSQACEVTFGYIRGKARGDNSLNGLSNAIMSHAVAICLQDEDTVQVYNAKKTHHVHSIIECKDYLSDEEI